MEIEPIRKYFEDNIKKGYTVEQISTNLKNNKYPDDVIHQAIQMLDPEIKALSQQNPQKFDYSKLPNNVKQHIEPQQTPVQTQQQAQQQDGQQPQKPKIETHPGLDQRSLILYGSIIGGILVVIVLGIFIFSGAEEEGIINDDFSSDNQQQGLSDEEREFRNSFEGTEEEEDDIDADIINESSGSENINASTNATETNNTRNTINATETNTTNSTGTEEEYESATGQFCQTDSDCDDGNVQTRNWCGADNRCRTGLNNPNGCVDDDNFCPESCYGKGDNDCVDHLGRMLCTENAHCDDDKNLTEDLCLDEKGYCVHFDIEPENNPPQIISEPELEAIVGELYTYDIVVEDKDEDDNITVSLKSAPSNMTIENTTLTWTPDEDEYWEDFTIVADDGEDEDEQDVRITIFLKEEEDNFRDTCGVDSACYLNMIIFAEEATHCKYLTRYWDELDSDDVDSCILTIAQNINDTTICQYITNETTQTGCENI